MFRSSVMQFKELSMLNEKTISIITGTTCAQICIDDIEFIDRDGKALFIYTDGYIYKTYEKIEVIAEPLKGYAFHRALVGLIINFDKVVRMDKYEMKFESGRKLAIGRNNHSKVRKAYKSYLHKYPPYVTVDWSDKPYSPVNTLKE